jgi:hypothetical protein
MSLSSTLLWCLLIAMPDGKMVLPEPITVRFRMLFLKPGMEKEQVEAVLGLRNRFSLVSGTLLWSFKEYSLGHNHTLGLDYSYNSGRERWLLRFAELRWGRKLVARVPAAKRKGKESGGFFPGGFAPVWGRKAPWKE